jgi:hypothetical protein
VESSTAIKVRAIVVNLRTRFGVYCPECHVVDYVESLREAEMLAAAHECREPERIRLTLSLVRSGVRK